MRTIVSSLFVAAVLAACQPADGDDPANADASADLAAEAADAASTTPATAETAVAEAAEPAIDECGASELGRWLNLLPTETAKAEIAEAVGHDRIRYIAPGDAVTMDFRPDRLDVETGEDGRIKLFRCG